MGRSMTLIVTMLLAALVSFDARATIIWGANGHPLVSYPGTSIEQQLDLLKDLGMTSYRVDVREQSASNLAGLAELIRQAKKRGIEILPVLVFPKDLGAETEQSL